MSDTPLRIRSGSRIRLHYRLSLAGGKVVESTDEAGPISIEVGKSAWLPALEQRLYGLQRGDARCFKIPANETSHHTEPGMVHRITRDLFPPDFTLEVDTVVGFDLPDGSEIVATIVEVRDQEVLADFSSPLAARDLVFEVNIVDVE